MKILVYSCRKDEAEYFRKFSEQHQVEVTLCKEAPTLENADMAKGYECISILTNKIDAQLMEKFHSAGVKFISTRTIGYDHIDIDAAKKLEIQVANVAYSPYSVAEYTVMLILMAIRKIKTILARSNIQDYSLDDGVQGKQLHNLTIGVIGTGRIGRTVIQCLRGFGCKVIAYDINQNAEIAKDVAYVPLAKLFAESDIITLHAPATKENFHLINKDSIALMKDGVYIVNTARGSLIDTKALIDAVEKKKIGGAALDVMEQESNLYYHNLKSEILDNRELSLLNSFPNVIITPHTAFYTDQTVSDMVEHSILSCISFMQKDQ
ncbi:MAG: Phenyllactate dehydrogenase [Eubacteriales bacterium]|jgi:lactate dehydrogenase-like 2-hydroxyacid dehydrogenase